MCACMHFVHSQLHAVISTIILYPNFLIMAKTRADISFLQIVSIVHYWQALATN